MKLWWLKEGLTYGLSATLAKFMGVLLAPIYTRFMSPSEFGLLDLATSLSAILLILAETQMISGFMRSYYEAKAKNAVSLLTGTIVGYYLLSSLIVVPAAYASHGLLERHLPGFEQSALIPVLIGLLPAQLVGLCLVVLRLERRPTSYLLISVGQIGLGAILGILSVTVYDAGAVGVLYGLAVARCVFGVISMILVLRMFGPRPGLQYLGQLWCFGAPIVPARIASWARTYASRLFIAGMLSLSALGVFSIAVKIATISLLLVTSIRMVWQPFANERYSARGSEITFARALNIYAFFLLCSLVILTTASPLILRLLTPTDYWGAEPYVSLLAASFLWDGAAMFFSVGNNWERKTYFNSFGSIAASLLNLALLFWGTARFGLPLVACAAFLTAIVKGLLILLTSQRNHHIPYSKRVIAASMIASGIYAFLPYWLLSYTGATILCCTAMYFVSGVGILLAIWNFALGIDDRAWFAAVVQRAGRSG